MMKSRLGMVAGLGLLALGVLWSCAGATANPHGVATAAGAAAAHDVTVSASRGGMPGARAALQAGGRRLEIVIQDPPPERRDRWPDPTLKRWSHEEELPPLPAVAAPVAKLQSPDGGEIHGTMIVGQQHFAVTPTRLLSVGDPVGELRVRDVSVDHVVLASADRSFELDVRTGLWSQVRTARPAAR